MTIYWINRTGAIIKATSIVPDLMPPELKGATAVDGDVSGAPESGQQTWDGSKWSAPPPPKPTLDEKIDALIEAVNAQPGSKLDDIKNRL